LPVLSHGTNKKNENIKKDKNTKGRKKKKENSVTIINVKKVKLEEQEDCIDVETIPRDEVPGI